MVGRGHPAKLRVGKAACPIYLYTTESLALFRVSYRNDHTLSPLKL
uniref:Uncharacterized protein n=1 Tax=Anguilla anguilla TaxID=7936 RepID=A0A0E9PFM6_ANGAN